MPGGDRTGPWGAGPMTGRGAGYCAGFSMPGYANPMYAGGMGYGRGRGFGRGMGMGYGRGMGGGRGWRNMYYATGVPGWARGYGAAAPGYWQEPQVAEPSAKDEMAYLRQEAKHLNQALADINKRIEELDGK